MESEKIKTSFLKEVVPLEIDKSWNGKRVDGSEKAQICFRVRAQNLEVEVCAPYHNDPAPSLPAGELDGLWEYEVIELFLLGASGHYLEIELGPHGHYLILLHNGIRAVKKRLNPQYSTTNITGLRWQATLKLDIGQLPLPFTHANAYAIHGQAAERRYLAAYPVPGEKPDFHQPRFFGRLHSRH